MTTKKRGDLRKGILAAAMDILRESGPLALTQPRVAQRAGVAQGHLTYYFPTRGDLLHAVAEATAKTLLADFARLSSAARRPAGLRKFARGPEARARTRLLLNFVLAAGEEPEIRALFRTLTTDIRTQLAAGLAAEGFAADARSVALLHALAVGLAVLDLARAEPESARDIERVLPTALQALEPDPPPRRRRQ